MSEEVDLTNTQTLVDRLAANRVIDARYRLDRQLGRGGMGVVWLAQDEILQRPVALKFLAELLANDRSAIEDLKHETSRCLELTHPRIVRIYDFVQDAGLAAISMEFVEGQTLSERRAGRPNRCFDADDLLAWVEQLADALSYAHGESRVVHRDLKPSNLMIDRGGLLKVSDFGISRSLSDSLTRVSRTARISGTMAYMSPQQGEGRAPTASDDIYAVGATLFELLTGKPPFYGPAALVFQQLLHVAAPSVNERRRELTNAQCAPVPAAWEATIAACLAKNPADRPKDVREIAERLRVETATHIAVTVAMAAPLPATAHGAPIAHVVPATQVVHVTPAASVASAGVIPPASGRPWLWPALTVGMFAVLGAGWVAWQQGGATGAGTSSQRVPIAHTPAPSSPSPSAQAFKPAATPPPPLPAKPEPPSATTAIVSPPANTPLPQPVDVATEAPAATPKPIAPAPTAVTKVTSVPSTKPKSRAVKPVQRAEADPEPKPRRKAPETSISRPAVAAATPKPTPKESSVTEEERQRAATARLIIERSRPPH